MSFSASLFRWALLLPLTLALSGCDPAGTGQLEEEKEPHFLTGKNRERAMDFAGAVEAFEKAVEVNPGSGAAHFELAWLSAEKENDPAAAIYHYQHYLKLRPNAENAGLVAQRILICKQDLARQVSLGPVNETVQRDLEQLATEKRRLTDENKHLRADLEQWGAYARSLQALTNRPSAPEGVQASPLLRTASFTTPAGKPSVSSTASSPSQAEPSRPSKPQPEPPSAGQRTHTVVHGETPSIIARKYGVRLESLLSANPGLNPRRMRVGQTLNIPSR